MDAQELEAAQAQQGEVPFGEAVEQEQAQQVDVQPQLQPVQEAPPPPQQQGALLARCLCQEGFVFQ